MKINVLLDDGAKMPTKAHGWDAGFDLYSPINTRLFDHDDVTIDTKVHMQIPEGYCGLLVSKSGLNVKEGITGTGLIDAGYSGAIMVKLYRDAANRETYRIKEGDKICQIIILPVPEVELVQVESLAETERGSNGFGSSGR